ncbi:Sensor protein ZraS [Novipirellula aureliae]|uniref:histidine kinase n=1 Tax=Novipirellula aureliae TaxID=2527966 RepID=A0A5C6DBN2_9BACT|nr:HAMP domain-containing sensor histidine kinase [Novipirellula aureliae]TWU34108.1 Sensor protein ZraS [Novipirellula aureliae]
MMKRSGLIAAGFGILAWLLFGAWQWRETTRQNELIRGNLVSQAESILDCLVATVQSHRWISPYFQSQLPTMLEEIANSPNVLAVSIQLRDNALDSDDTTIEHYRAGNQNLIKMPGPLSNHWQPEGYYAVREFELRSDPPMGPPSGRGGGGGGGMGLGRKLRQSIDANDESTDEHKLTVMLVLDRHGVGRQIQREARNRWLLVLLGGLLIFVTGWTWRTTVRLAESQGHAGILRAEAHHFAQLSHAAAGLAHETRNPLGLIRGWAQRLVQQQMPSEEQQQQAEAIVEECDRVTARINEFLSFARPVEPQLAPVPLRDLVEQLRTLLESDLAIKQVQFDVEGIPKDLRILAAAESLRQAIFNLVQNAVSFAKYAGCVTIRANQTRNGVWCIEVLDDGEGVESKNIESLFEPYFTTRSSGTGLGLAIVQRIAIAHHWIARYKPNPSGGAIFQIDEIEEANRNP